MTREQEIRDEILLQLYGAGAVPVSITHIQKVARRQGFNYTESELRTQMMFLCDRGLAKRDESPATGEVKYRITADGMTHYENS